MSFRSILPALIGVTLMGTTLNACTPTTPIAEAGPRAIWVWSYSWADKPEEATALLDFAKANKVDTFYLESESMIQESPARLEEFIHQAAAQSIRVELLFGGHQWVENPAVAVALAKRAADFIKTMAEPKAKAIHFDVEPHALPTWDADQQRLSGLYVDLLDQLRAAVGQTELNVDIGHFYGSINLTRNGVSKSLLRWVIERVDGAVLMAYNSTPRNVLAFIKDEFAQAQLAQAQLTQAKGSGPKLRVALACDCDLSPLENYCSRETLEHALSVVQQAYGADPSFSGLAVHSYGSYRILK
jgi:hypothetical protein